MSPWLARVPPPGPELSKLLDRLHLSAHGPNLLYRLARRAYAKSKERRSVFWRRRRRLTLGEEIAFSLIWQAVSEELARSLNKKTEAAQ